tara:strand:- start:1357 stop:1869 length:513 start_codon:yes stop_codon:yes gene_type:complete
MKKKQRSKKSGLKRLQMVIVIGVILIGVSIYYFYSAEQAQIRGYTFGNELQAIQDELKDEQADFYSKVSMWKEKQRLFLKDDGNNHIAKMKDIIAKYANLNISDGFSGSVKLFKLSTETQLESDQHLINWIINDDRSEKIRADELLQASFEYEMAALSLFEEAKKGIMKP